MDMASSQWVLWLIVLTQLDSGLPNRFHPSATAANDLDMEQIYALQDHSKQLCLKYDCTQPAEHRFASTVSWEPEPQLSASNTRTEAFADWLRDY